MHAQQYNLYGKWNQIMPLLNVMAALKRNVMVNSCQIMDHTKVSQLHKRQMGLEAIATGTFLSYGEEAQP